jgi:diguanylate cyclase (GGDEF)-like protein/PAS domain S-box-containing protein
MCEGRLRVLLVEDDRDDYVLTDAILEEIYGPRVDLEWAPTYETGREALLARSHDVCLLDYRLGPCNGLDLMREVVAAGRPTPIILLTGTEDWDVDVEAMRAGAADYLIKGQIDGRLLERSIRYAIGFAAERQRTLESLRLSEERYALAVRGANDGIWDWDLRAETVYFSPRWKAMLGHREDEVGDSSSEWFDRVHPRDLERLWNEIEDHVAGRTEHFQSEHRVLHSDGTYLWVLTRGLGVRDGSGKVHRMAGSQSDITARKQAEERLVHDAFHDALTGLPNRALLLDRIEQRIGRMRRRSGTRFALLFLDLDGFKLVNDSLGHQAGDQLLICLGRRLTACLRGCDTVARLGGDEFVVLIDDVEEEADATSLADRIHVELRPPFLLNDFELITTVSIGIVLAGPTYECAEELLRDADIAMYRAKGRGKAGHAVFHEEMLASAVSRMRLEADLRQALARQEFVLFYQPVVSLDASRVVGFEALVRWRHPIQGNVPPDEFIPIAEETRLIQPLGLWILREAIEQLMRWQKEHWARPPLSMNVNLSRRQFLQPDLIYQIKRVLLETGVDPRCLCLEITENSIMEDVEAALEGLGRLRELGVRVAIDDFGKGYSSLSFLHEFPCDLLKLDRTFVSRIGVGGDNDEIVRTILALARGLRLGVVAEGVETERQRDHLRELGCAYAQGFLFSRPIDANSCIALLDRARRRPTTGASALALT